MGRGTTDQSEKRLPFVPVVTVEQFIAGVGAMLDEFPGGRCRFMRIGR